MREVSEITARLKCFDFERRNRDRFRNLRLKLTQTEET